MKTINISRKNGIVNICLDIDLNNKKSPLKINEKKSEERFNKILNKVTDFSKFNELSLNYNEIDYYDNTTDYNTPYIKYTKDLKKPTISYQQHGCIPNNWSERFSLSLNNPKTIKPIEIFLEEFDIKLSNEQIKGIRKAIGGNSLYNIKL